MAQESKMCQFTSQPSTERSLSCPAGCTRASSPATRTQFAGQLLYLRHLLAHVNGNVPSHRLGSKLLPCKHDPHALTVTAWQQSPAQQTKPVCIRILRFGFDGPRGGHAEQLLHQSRLASVSSKVQRCVACTVLLIYICPLT